MEPFSRIIGHANTTERLRRALVHGVPHALVLHGARHLGKATVARAFAAALLGTDRPEAHPDFRLIERLEDAKTGKLHKGIGVDDIREARAFLHMSAMAGGRKAVIIDGAETLTEEAANALLKTLEEPPEGGHIILVAHALERLPATVRSRAAVLGLARLSDAELETALLARNSNPSDVREAVMFAAGRPGIALSLMEGGSMLDWYRTEGERWKAFRAGTLRTRFSAASSLAPPKEDRETAITRLRDAASYWEMELRRELLGGNPDAASRLHALRRLTASLDLNVQPRLLLERFAIEFDSSPS